LHPRPKTMVIWLTGLPGAGKTTIATLLIEKLRLLGKQSLLLDGDALRDALQMKGYDSDSRKAIALTYARLGQMFSEQGSIAICATVSMFDSVRDWNAANISDYFEVYIKVSDEVLIARNKKDLYSTITTGAAVNTHDFNLAGIKHMETPKIPHLVINNNGLEAPVVLVEKILAKLLAIKTYDKWINR
jgi:adenylylsulfate kinase-like enzyme